MEQTVWDTSDNVKSAKATALKFMPKKENGQKTINVVASTDPQILDTVVRVCRGRYDVVVGYDERGRSDSRDKGTLIAILFVY